MLQGLVNNDFFFFLKICCLSFPPVYLRDTELTGCELFFVLIHFLVALGLSALQLFAALHQSLHLRLHLTDVQTSHCELFINETSTLMLHRQRKRNKDKERKRTEVREEGEQLKPCKGN